MPFFPASMHEIFISLTPGQPGGIRELRGEIPIKAESPVRGRRKAAGLSAKTAELPKDDKDDIEKR